MKLEERRRIHELSREQLVADLAEAEHELLNYRFDAGLKRLTNPSALHNARKRVARLKTLIHQRDLLADHGFATMEEYKAYRAAERKTYREQRRAR